jgi:septal ring factor EnvC (AmiA/AmiB activator)
MSLQQELERVDSELEAIRGDLIRLEARQAGLRAERDRLAAGIQARPKPTDTAATPPIRDLSKNEAIMAVLKQADHEMSIDEVVTALKSGGRSSENYGVVAIYLGNLAKDGRVRRVRRGYYTSL